MKKQILLFTLLLSVTASAFTGEVEIGGLWYELVSKAKIAKVIQYKNYNYYCGNIMIPETVEYEGTTYSVTSIGENAFSGCKGLISVTIPGSVTNLENGAFWCCSNMASITIPNSVTKIGNGAFVECSSLTSITIPNSVTSIGSVAFSSCSGLTTITIPGSVTNMGSGAFSNCSGLTSVTIQDGVTSIGESAFYGCSSMTSITIPNSVTSIGSSAFSNCSGLTSVTIPNSVTSIGSSAFYNCSGLTSVTIPNSVTSLGSSAFCNCSGLISITIPNSVKNIESNAFSNCSGLITITIGSGVETIGSQAFANCPELADVYCYAEKVPGNGNAITRSNSWTDIFDGSYIEYATLHVPTASIDAYKAVEPWKNFKTIIGLDGSMPEIPKCATPTIAIVDGELEFSCATDGVDFVSEVTSKEVKKYYDSKVKIVGTYTVSVYATKAGYDNSDVASLEFTLGPGGEVCDVNKDGAVDVADISTIISKMASQARTQEGTIE